MRYQLLALNDAAPGTGTSLYVVAHTDGDYDFQHVRMFYGDTTLTTLAARDAAEAVMAASAALDYDALEGSSEWERAVNWVSGPRGMVALHAYRDNACRECGCADGGPWGRCPRCSRTGCCQACVERL